MKKKLFYLLLLPLLSYSMSREEKTRLLAQKGLEVTNRLETTTRTVGNIATNLTKTTDGLNEIHTASRPPRSSFAESAYVAIETEPLSRWQKIKAFVTQHKGKLQAAGIGALTAIAWFAGRKAGYTIENAISQETSDPSTRELLWMLLEKTRPYLPTAEDIAAFQDVTLILPQE